MIASEAPGTIALSDTPPFDSVSTGIPNDVDLFSPRTPVYYKCGPDPDFMVKLWKAWDSNMEITGRLRRQKQLLRESKYGKEIAERYSPGATPEAVSSEYARRQEELTRQYYEQTSDSSEDHEWVRQKTLRLKRGRRVRDSTRRCSEADPVNAHDADPNSNARSDEVLRQSDYDCQADEVECPKGSDVSVGNSSGFERRGSNICPVRRGERTGPESIDTLGPTKGKLARYLNPPSTKSHSIIIYCPFNGL
jgi:hypothetical protein